LACFPSASAAYASAALQVCDFVIANKDTFVGIDLANDELSHDSLNFKDFFLKAADAGVNVTVHSGEVRPTPPPPPLPGPRVPTSTVFHLSFRSLSTILFHVARAPPQVPVDEAPQWVWNSIEQLRAQRIGHGFNIIRDPAAVAKAAARGTVFEVCPSSNYLCQGVASVAEHPLAKLVAGGLRCTLNTDDPGMFGVDLNNEVEIAVRHTLQNRCFISSLVHMLETHSSLSSSFLCCPPHVRPVADHRAWPLDGDCRSHDAHRP
jgi:hypothetical protein